MVFRVGQKVVCIKKDAWKPSLDRVDFPPPVYGEVYTVSARMKHNGHAAVSLVELGDDTGFLAKYFLPAVDPGMEILNAIRLNTKLPIAAPEGPRRAVPLREFDPALGVTKYLPRVRP